MPGLGGRTAGQAGSAALPVPFELGFFEVFCLSWEGWVFFCCCFFLLLCFLFCVEGSYNIDTLL